EVTVHWIAGHSDVEGNELADKEEKRAAESWRNNSMVDELLQYLLTGHLPILPTTLLSAIKQAFKKDTKRRWERMWTKSPLYACAQTLDPNILSHSF
ncbi:hypothetical protein EV702DRAFT_939548, partial [Suillus placidus]